jgi:hypothetical protein
MTNGNLSERGFQGSLLALLCASALGCGAEDLAMDGTGSESVGESRESVIPGAKVTQANTIYAIRAGSSLTDVTVRCPSGSVMVGGGQLAPSTKVRVHSSAPDGNGWVVSAQNLGSSASDLNVVAECLSGTRATSSTAAPATILMTANSWGCTTATCPRGTLLTGGGYYAPNSFRASTSQLNKSGAWEVCGWNENPSESIQAFVYPVCVSGVTGSVTRQSKGALALPAKESRRYDSEPCPIVQGTTPLLLGSGGHHAAMISVYAMGSTRSFQDGARWSTTFVNTTNQVHTATIITACLNLWQ